jgi:hypothetical protein
LSPETLTSPLSHVLRRCGLSRKISPTAGFPREKTKATSGLPRSYCGRIAALVLMPDLRLATNTAHDLQSVTTYLLLSSYPDSRRMQSTLLYDQTAASTPAQYVSCFSPEQRQTASSLSCFFALPCTCPLVHAACRTSALNQDHVASVTLTTESCMRTIAASHDTRLRRSQVV